MQVLDKYMAEIKRNAADLGGQAQSHAWRICDLLEDIRAALTQDDDERHASSVVILANNAVNRPICNVPAGEIWELEFASTDDSTTGFIIRLYQNDSFRAAAYGTSGSGLQLVKGLRFVGPCGVTALNSHATIDATAYFQFRKIKRRPAQSAHNAGQRETGISAIDAQRQHDVLHAGVPANGVR